MRRPWVAVLALTTMCAPPERREESPAESRAFPACLAGTPAKRFRLPAGLREISGLAAMADGRLLAHDDEHGEIGEIDPDGRIVKAFALEPRLVADFEGIAVAEDRIFLLVSDGRLIETREGAPGERVPYTVHRTGFERACEFEGLAYEPDDRSLLLLCKTAMMKELRGTLTVFRWSVTEHRPMSPDRMSIALPKELRDRIGGGFRGSGLERHPVTGQYLAISSINRAALLFTRSGELVEAAPLSRWHQQPEAVAILADGRVVLGDEGGKSAGRLTIYSCGQ